MKILAHRGDTKHGAENSLRAMKAAIDGGFDGIECDVRVSADGVPCIHHDANLKRMTGVDLEIGNTSFSDIASVFFLNSEDTTPTLKDLLELCHSMRLVNLEIKSSEESYAKIVEAVRESVEKYPELMDAIVFSSFNPSIIPYIHEHLKGYPVGLLLEEGRLPGWEPSEEDCPDILLPHVSDVVDAGVLPLTAPHCWTWTVRDVEQLKWLREKGCCEAVIAECSIPESPE